MKQKSAPNIHYFYFERILDFIPEMEFEDMEKGNIFSRLKMIYTFYEDVCNGEENSKLF